MGEWEKTIKRNEYDDVLGEERESDRDSTVYSKRGSRYGGSRRGTSYAKLTYSIDRVKER